MTKSKLLRLYQGLDPNSIIIKLYDECLLKLDVGKDLIERNNKSYSIDDYVVKSVSIADIMGTFNGLEVQDFVRLDTIYGIVTANLTYREVYDDYRHLLKDPRNLPVIVEDSKKSLELFEQENQLKLQKIRQENTRLLNNFIRYIGYETRK